MISFAELVHAAACCWLSPPANLSRSTRMTKASSCPTATWTWPWFMESTAACRGTVSTTCTIRGTVDACTAPMRRKVCTAGTTLAD